MAQQPGRKFTPAIPATRGSDGQIQGGEDSAKVRRRPRLDPQPLQSGTPSQPPRSLQAKPLRGIGRVAAVGSLKASLSGTLETDSI